MGTRTASVAELARSLEPLEAARHAAGFVYASPEVFDLEKERLFMNNGTRVRELLQARKGNLADWLANTAAPVEERVDRLYLSVLTRLPKPEERRLLVEHLNADPQKRGQLAEEAIWALINCSEFRFNH